MWPDGGPIEDGRGDSISPETLVLGEANLTLETLETLKQGAHIGGVVNAAERLKNCFGAVDWLQLVPGKSADRKPHDRNNRHLVTKQSST